VGEFSSREQRDREKTPEQGGPKQAVQLLTLKGIAQKSSCDKINLYGGRKVKKGTVTRV